MAEWIAVDSNVLTYLLDAIDEEYGLRPDASAIGPERLAMIRCFFYADCSFWVSPTVKAEYFRIGDEEKQRKHDRWSKFLLEDLPPSVPTDVLDSRTSELGAYHGGLDDCRLVAEVESLGIKTLLSCDRELIANLNGKCRLGILRPSEFLASLGLGPGAEPRLVPVKANPLARQTWWRL